MTKSRVIQWVGIVISLVAVGLLLRTLRLDHVVNALQSASYWWLAPAVLASLISFVFRAERFRALLARLSRFSLVRSYQYIAINYMGNNVLPARAGEVLLSYVVRQREGVGMSSSLAVTVLGRITDGLFLLAILLATVLILPFPSWVQQVLMLGFALFGLALAGLLWLVFGQARHHTSLRLTVYRVLPDWFERILTLLVRTIKGFQQGLTALRQWKVVAWSLCQTLLIWVAEGLVFYIVGRAVGIDLSIASWFFTLAMVNLATTIPSGPASIGTFEGVVVVVLSLAGVPTETAAAYALLLHATQVLPVTLIGAASYFSLSVRGLARSRNSEIKP